MHVDYQKISSYKQSVIKEGILNLAQSQGGFTEILGTRTSILIKPNLLMAYPPESAVTTHPVVILALAELLLDYGYTPAVADSPAMGTAESIIQTIGLSEPLRQLQVKTFGFTRSRAYSTQIPGYKRLSIARELDQFDGLINVPKLKTHCQAYFTGALKNLYGCVVGKRKAYRHMTSKNNLSRFYQMLNANAVEADPLWNLVDGVQALHKMGPRFGEVYPGNILLASTDFHAVDLAICRLIGIDVNQHPQFAMVDTNGLDFACDERWSDFIHAPQQAIQFSPFRVFTSVIKQVRSTLLQH